MIMSLGATKDIYMHMLLHLNDDFDDDLLMEAIGLLVWKLHDSGIKSMKWYIYGLQFHEK